MGLEVSSTARVEEARRVLRDTAVKLVVVGCRDSCDLDQKILALTLPVHVKLVVASSQQVSSSRRACSFIPRPCSWPALKRAIEQNDLYEV